MNIPYMVNHKKSITKNKATSNRLKKRSNL